MLVLGNKSEEGIYEIENTATKEKKSYTEQELLEEFLNIKNNRKYL